MGKKGGKLSQALASHNAKQQSKAKEAVVKAAREAKLASIGKGRGKAERKDLAEKKLQKVEQLQATNTSIQTKARSSLDKYRSKGKGKRIEKEVEAKAELALETGHHLQSELRSEELHQHPIDIAVPEGKVKMKSRAKHRPVQPFDPEDTILLVGEGNFSFTLSLVSPSSSQPSKYTHSTSQILSTAYDSESECYSKYPDARSNVEKIRKLAGRDDVVVFGVDAGQLTKCRNVTGRKKGEKEDRAKQRRWSKVWFGFPHNGEYRVSELNHNLC